MIAYIGVGSNQGRPIELVREAIAMVAELDSVTLGRQSSLYLTAPQDFLDQADFVNAVIEIDVDLEPLPLLDALQEIEADFGRVRDAQRFGPRPIDLDILMIDDVVVDSERLILPHPRMHKRAFVLVPLAEIAPELVIPGRGDIRKLLDDVRDQRIDPV